MPDIHPTAVIAAGARIHQTCRVGPYAVIGEGVRLGPDNIVGPHVVIEGDTAIGADNRFLASCSIGASPQITGGGDVGRLTIGNGNVVREFVTIHAGSEAVTRLGSRNLIMATAHVAHDCRVGDDVVLANGATLGGHVEIDDLAQVSGLCAIHQHVRIGTLAFVAGGSIVTQDVAPYCLVQGDRARLVSLNLVGLRRAGLSPADIGMLKRAYRELFLSTAPMAARITAVEAASPDERVMRLVDFLRNSRRGVITAPRRNFRTAA